MCGRIWRENASPAATTSKELKMLDLKMISRYQYLHYIVDTTKNFTGRFIESGWDYWGDAHDRYKELRETFGDRFAEVTLATILKRGCADPRFERYWILGAIA
jgi:hypothetical protein